MRQSRGSKVETEARPCEAEPAKKNCLEPRQMPRGLHPCLRQIPTAPDPIYKVIMYLYVMKYYVPPVH